MQTITITSEHAYSNWNETVDSASAKKNEVVIEQYGKPVATLVNYTLFEEMKRELMILQGLKNAERSRQERMEQPSSTVTLTELAEKLNLVEPPAIDSRARAVGTMGRSFSTHSSDLPCGRSTTR